MLEQLNNSLELIVTQTQYNFHYLTIIVAILWGMYLITLIQPKFLLLGIVPRTVHGILGIIFAPILHANFNHLFFNTIPLLVLSNFLLINGLNYFILVTISITLISGFLVWCFGKKGLHIGASAVITGYWALLVSNIVQLGTTTAIILGSISAYYFAGIFFGIFPTQKGVSWEGHFFGLIAGVIVAFFANSIY